MSSDWNQAIKKAFAWTVGGLLPLALVASILHCTSPASADSSSSSQPSPLAEVGGTPITWSELEERAADGLAQLEGQRRTLLEQGLELLIEEKLLGREAAKRGTTVEALLAAEVEAKSAAVSDADVDAWYEANKARLGGQPKVAVADRVRVFLGQQNQAQRRQELIAALKESHGVRVHYEPRRLVGDFESAPSKGPADAPLTLVEYSDFQCPYCKQMGPALAELSERYGDRLRIVFQQFPLNNIHPEAQKAAEASLCAHEQGKFWEMHDAIFAKQKGLEPAWLRKQAQALGLDEAAFGSCLDSGEMAATVRADMRAGQRVGVGETPSFFLNGQQVRLTGQTPPTEQLAALIDEELAKLDC